MNFLAHLDLTQRLLGDDEEAMLGALLPDLIRGPLPKGLSPRLIQAVELHRRVDRLTDVHPIFEQTRQRLRPAMGRYAGVLTDIAYDHALHQRWHREQPGSTPTKLALFYDRLSAHPRRLHPQHHTPFRHLIEQDWLGQPATRDGLLLNLHRLSEYLRYRTGRHVDLTHGAQAIAGLGDQLARDFEAFYPDLEAQLAPMPTTPTDPA